jgi:hypothetical protein
MSPTAGALALPEPTHGQSWQVTADQIGIPSASGNYRRDLWRARLLDPGGRELGQVSQGLHGWRWAVTGRDEGGQEASATMAAARLLDALDRRRPY